MGSSMRKTTLREIRQSFGRYFAIVAIVALGVGLFSGLKVTKSAMVKSAQQYFDQTNLYDIRLVSTIGFDTDTAKHLSRRERILDAEGAISVDVLMQNDEGEESVLMVHSLMEEQNQPVIVHGRLPQSPDECVVDALSFGEDSIGAVLTLSSNNDEDTDEMFLQKSFRIVGTVNSSYYANYERGTTSLGNGTIQGFMMVERDAFDCDYDTEIFLKVNTGGAAIYSDEYDDAVDEVTDWLEDYAQEQADQRYERLKAEAQEELYTAQQQLANETSKGEMELNDASAQLSSAVSELQSGKTELQSGKAQLESGKTQLLQQEQELQQQKTELLLQKQEVLNGLSQVRAAKSMTINYDAASYAQALSQEQELQASLTQIESGLAEIESGLQQIQQQ